MSYSTCRFCKKSSFDGDDMVKYGVRHYAHFQCYLDAGKTLDTLSSWQANNFPYFLLKARGLLDHPKLRRSADAYSCTETKGPLDEMERQLGALLMPRREV